MILHGINAPTNIRHNDSLARPIKDISPAELWIASWQILRLVER